MLLIAFLGVMIIAGYIMWVKNIKKPPRIEIPEKEQTPFEMFPKNEVRANQWIGILQEDIYKDPSGSIGTFVGKVDESSIPTYTFTS
jgi:hypothetical protein